MLIFLSSISNPADTTTIPLLGGHPRVIGIDFCGRVIEATGCEGSGYEPGDIVAGVSSGSYNRPIGHGTHQEYMSLAPCPGVYKVPENMPPHVAAAISAILQTCNDGLFNRLKLPLPSEITQKGDLKTKTLIVWGGSTGVGMCTIQVARAIGFQSIIVTASPKRHELLKSLGATRCYDYSDPGVVDAVKAAIREDSPAEETLLGMDAVGNSDSMELLEKSVSEKGDQILLTSVALNPGSRWEAMLGGRHDDLDLIIPGQSEPFKIPAVPKEAEKMRKALEWALENYGKKFKFETINVFRGTAEEALEEALKVGKLGHFGKLVLEHPLK